MQNTTENEIGLIRPCPSLDGSFQPTPIVSNPVIASDMQLIGGGQQPVTVTLTTRQCEILRMLAEGNTTKRIAGTLHISPKTVETHRIRIKERLGINSIPGLVRYALRAGLVRLEN